jgi:cation:H+ antiporter
VIGMTIVAFGTSAPEFLVSLQAAMAGNPEIAVGNVIGSNIANIALILGLTGLIYPIAVNKQAMTIDFGWMMIATILFGIFASNGQISRLEGTILTFCLILFIILQINYTRRSGINIDNVQETSETKGITVASSLLFIAISCCGLAYGARFLVSAASNIAASLGVSERVIGITIVAIGTSLPELVTTVIAATKKQSDIALGNIIGSNIFNLFFVIGLSSLIKPINIDWSSFVGDYYWMFGISVLLLILVIPIFKTLKSRNKSKSISKQLFDNGKLGRAGGAILFSLYIIYILSLLFIDNF